MDFELNRADLHESRIVLGDPPSPRDGEAVLRIESFGLTSNNITYAVFGEAMSYWNFFPPSDPGWGRLNVYQGYRDVETDPVYSADLEAEHILFFPLFFTSFLIDDFLADEDFFGADTIVISSGSSKTAIIAAHLLAKREGIETVGLTSAGNREFVEGLDIYDSVHLYDDVSQPPGDRAVYVDVSCDGAVRTDVHAHYGNRLAHSAAVGMTHWTQMATGRANSRGRAPSSSSPRTESPSVAPTGAQRSSTRASPTRGYRSRSGRRIGYASSASRLRPPSGVPTSICLTARSTRRLAPSWTFPVAHRICCGNGRRHRDRDGPPRCTVHVF